MMLISWFLQVVDALYDCKSEVIGPGFFRFKAEIGTNFASWHSPLLRQLLYRHNFGLVFYCIFSFFIWFFVALRFLPCFVPVFWLCGFISSLLQQLA
jgi:hypothetical protein